MGCSAGAAWRGFQPGTKAGRGKTYLADAGANYLSDIGALCALTAALAGQPLSSPPLPAIAPLAAPSPAPHG